MDLKEFKIILAKLCAQPKKRKKKKSFNILDTPSNLYFMYIHMALEGIYALRNLNNAITMALKCH